VNLILFKGILLRRDATHSAVMRLHRLSVTLSVRLYSTRHPIPFMFGSRVGFFGDGGSNGAISGWIKSKMAAGAHLGKLQTAISQQRIIRFIYVCTQIWPYFALGL